jgi:hypothetical protein
VNVAFDKTAYMSSINGTYGPGNALDGTKIPTLMDNSCSCTSTQNQPYWIVDLEKQFLVSYVSIMSSEVGKFIVGYMYRYGNSVVSNLTIEF